MLVVGFDPVYLAVFEREECDCSEYFVVIFESIYFIIFCQCGLELVTKSVVRTVADAENIDTVVVKPVTELPEVVRKVR